MNTHRNRTLHHLRRGWECERQKILNQMVENSSQVWDDLKLDHANLTDEVWSKFTKECDKRNVVLKKQLAIYHKCKFPYR